MTRLFRWLGKNLSTILLAFILAIVVWVSAVVAADPNEERVYPRQVDIEIIGLVSDLLITNDYQSQARLTLNAPRSIWDQLTEDPDLVRTWVDASNLEKGEHSVEVMAQVSANPVRIIQIDPESIDLVLEPLMAETYPVELEVIGDPALGYRKGIPVLKPDEVIISGPESSVRQVVKVSVVLDISGSNETVRRSLPVQAFDENGDQVEGVTLSPQAISITQPITLQGGFRNVAVRVVTTGEVADGYWLTNINIIPPNVTVFSANPELVNALPGFVETNPIDLTGLSDDVDVRATLNLPEGVSLAGEESVLVRLSIAALEGSLPINLAVEAIGLPPDYAARIMPDTVQLLLIGPLPILNNLNPAAIRVSVDLTGLEPGFYQVTPVVDLLPDEVGVASINPETVQVEVLIAPTQTATVEGTLSPGITPTVIPTRTPTLTPTATITPSPTPTPTPTSTSTPTITPTPKQ